MVSKAHWCSHQTINEVECPEDEDAQRERARVDTRKGDVT